MTEEKSQRFQYLDKEDLISLHGYLAEQAKGSGEPIPSFPHTKSADIDALILAPQQAFGGRELYPTLEEKAAILFYTINKRQIFLNGNKRMSTLCLLVFLGINGKQLKVSPDALTEKALWLANTASLEFPSIKLQITGWIVENLEEYSPE